MKAEAPKRPRGRPRKNPLPVAVAETPVEHASPDVVTVIGIKYCPNPKWIFASLNGLKVAVKAKIRRKSPKNQKIQCTHISGNQYQEV